MNETALIISNITNKNTGFFIAKNHIEEVYKITSEGNVFTKGYILSLDHYFVWGLLFIMFCWLIYLTIKMHVLGDLK